MGTGKKGVAGLIEGHSQVLKGADPFWAKVSKERGTKRLGLGNHCQALIHMYTRSGE